jgi:threonine/homoserine/homoserine lactone efflux protein
VTTQLQFIILIIIIILSIIISIIIIIITHALRRAEMLNIQRIVRERIDLNTQLPSLTFRGS